MRKSAFIILSGRILIIFLMILMAFTTITGCGSKNKNKVVTSDSDDPTGLNAFNETNRNLLQELLNRVPPCPNNEVRFEVNLTWVNGQISYGSSPSPGTTVYVGCNYEMNHLVYLTKTADDAINIFMSLCPLRNPQSPNYIIAKDVIEGFDVYDLIPFQSQYYQGPPPHPFESLAGWVYVLSRNFSTQIDPRGFKFPVAPIPETGWLR